MFLMFREKNILNYLFLINDIIILNFIPKILIQLIGLSGVYI